jgi:nucleotide-binding universal stress UspA family protein
VESGDGDLKLAAELCGEVDAHLAVLVVALAAAPPIGGYAATVSDAWSEEREADLERLRQRTAAVSALLASSTVSSDVSSEYPEAAWADDAIGRRARYADIAVLGPELLSHDELKGKTIEGVLFSSGKPLMLVPQGAKATLKPKRIVVAWDSRVEASRAVGQSLGMLIGAKDVRLVLVDPVEGEDDQGAEPGADAAAYLARHGVKVAVDRLPSQGRAVAQVLARHAIDTSADLMVMGAYGHSRLRQRIFGGVTRSMLDEPPLPVFLAH